LISYKDDQFYNLVTTDAFTLPGTEQGNTNQYLSEARYHLKYTMYDVRLNTKLGIHFRKKLWALGANISFPSLKLFGDGSVVKQYEYSNIHKDPGNTQGSGLFYGGRQQNCTAHFKDPLSVAAGVNYYSPSGKSVVLLTAEYFFGLSDFKYIEAEHDPGEDGYHYGPAEPEDWLSFTTHQNPVFNVGVAFKEQVNARLMVSGGFRTDFSYLDPVEGRKFPDDNRKTFYAFDLYHINLGLGYGFKRGSIILGTQYSNGRANDQQQIVNLTEPVEYISDSQMPLTGPISNNVKIRYNDISVYFGFMFNFLQEKQ
jgi:hypothetical protein